MKSFEEVGGFKKKQRNQRRFDDGVTKKRQDNRKFGRSKSSKS